ncbi:MAG: response regulator transcription factor [Anaerolineae bacterium]|nr:response regulator transcription factor [Anaerolineae bacterium]
MSEATKLLLADDEQAITDNLAPFLERSGFSVNVASDGEGALREIALHKPEFIILDVMMPRLNGREVLRRLRQGGNWTPVILLTQVGEAGERAMALQEGADDYLNKPFDPNELVARIRAILRRVQAGQLSLAGAHTLKSGELTLNRTTRRAYLHEHEITLTPKALNLLEYMMTRPDEIITRERLLDAVWGWDYPTGIRTVDTRVAELRRQLNDDSANPTYIETVLGEGYRFIGTVASASALP